MREARVERHVVLLVRRQAVVGLVVLETAELHLLVVRRLRRVVNRVGRRPVRVRDRAQRVVRVELVRVEIVALRAPSTRLSADALPMREKAARVTARLLHFLVVQHDRIRLPLAADDIRHDPRRNIRIVVAAGMAGRRCKIRRAVQQVDHMAHLGLVVGVESRIVEVVVRRQLGPHAVHEVQDAVRMREIPSADSPVKRRRKNRIDAHHIRVHRRDRVEPAGVQRRIRRKLRRKLSRHREPHVHALHIEGLPALTDAELEVLADGARREIERRGPMFHDRRDSPVPTPARGGRAARARSRSSGRARRRAWRRQRRLRTSPRRLRVVARPSHASAYAESRAVTAVKARSASSSLPSRSDTKPIPTCASLLVAHLASACANATLADGDRILSVCRPAAGRCLPGSGVARGLTGRALRRDGSRHHGGRHGGNQHRGSRHRADRKAHLGRAHW